MYIALLLILLIYQIIAAISDVREMKQLLVTDVTEAVRIRWYRSAILWGWIPVGIIALFEAFSALSWQEMGLRSVTFSNTTWLNVTALLFVTAALLLKGGSAVAYLCSSSYRRRIAEELAKLQQGGTHIAQVTMMMTPRTRKEKAYWSFCSLTAGVCEEITFRGCMPLLLSCIFPELPVLAIAVLAAGLFGLFHCYQGLQGVLTTGVVGLLFSFLFLAADSLLPGISLHFLFDFSNAFLLREEHGR